MCSTKMDLTFQVFLVLDKLLSAYDSFWISRNDREPAEITAGMPRGILKTVENIVSRRSLIIAARSAGYAE